MKKLIFLCFSFLLLVIVAGCSSNETSEPEQNDTTEAPKENVEMAYDVVLTDCGDSEFDVVRELRNNTELDLANSSAAVDNVPTTIATQLSKEDADNLKKILEDVGATIQINEVEKDNTAADTGVEVYLSNVGDRKMEVVIAIKNNTDLGLVEVKEIIDNAPTTVLSGLIQEEEEPLNRLFFCSESLITYKL